MFIVKSIEGKRMKEISILHLIAKMIEWDDDSLENFFIGYYGLDYKSREDSF